MRFLVKPPGAATILRVETRAMTEIQTLVELSIEETRSQPSDTLFDSVYAACESWAESAERKVKFVGQWIGEAGRTLATLQWSISPEGSGPMWDGNVESLIGHLHAKLAEKDKIFLELLRTSFEFNQQTVQSLTERNLYLEKQRLDTEKLREEFIRAEADIKAGNPDDDRRFRHLVGLAEKVLLAQFPGPQPGNGNS